MFGVAGNDDKGWFNERSWEESDDCLRTNDGNGIGSEVCVGGEVGDESGLGGRRADADVVAVLRDGCNGGGGGKRGSDDETKLKSGEGV